MAKLTRYLQKIFANNSNQVGVFGTGVDKETSKNVETLQSADYEEGWSSAIITNKNYPIWQEMDGVQYGLSYQLKYLFQNGIPEWLSTETYYTNSYCRVGSTIYYSLQDNNTNHNPSLQDGWWTPLLTSNRSIGEIVPSTIPLTEAGLHLLDGSLITNGMYADFVTYMANLTATAPDCFCSEADWQTAVSTYGVCGKFVYDSVNNTVRLPKYGNQIYTKDIASTAPAKGNGMGIGLTDGTSTGALIASTTGTANPIIGNTGYGANVGFRSSPSGWTDYGTIGVTSDPTKSGIITDLSDITTSLDCYYYIVIATSTKTEIEVDIDEIATDLNGKADVDLSNINASATAKNIIIGWGMPDYSAGVSVSTSGYTALMDGIYVGEAQKAANDNHTARVLVNLYDENNNAVLSSLGTSGYDVNTGNAKFSTIILPVPKGYSITPTYYGTPSTIISTFYPLKGAS